VVTNEKGIANHDTVKKDLKNKSLFNKKRFKLPNVLTQKNIIQKENKCSPKQRLIIEITTSKTQC
jgi:hypothetical protein